MKRRGKPIGIVTLSGRGSFYCERKNQERRFELRYRLNRKAAYKPLIEKRVNQTGSNKKKNKGTRRKQKTRKKSLPYAGKKMQKKLYQSKKRKAKVPDLHV